MEVMFVMISNKLNTFIILSVSLFLASCETIGDITGLNKPTIEDNIFSETPDLVLPPDFGKEPVADSNQLSQRIERPDYPNINLQNNYQSINPRITNYISPKINIQSSPSPSDSLERFKKNKKFTIGEWVYSQYVDGFKRGNLYYRPVYDKGYNFSRRYLPGSNVSSFNSEQPSQIINNSQFQQSIENSNQSEFNTFDQLPILD
jgi:hypothetical protein